MTEAADCLTSHLEGSFCSEEILESGRCGGVGALGGMVLLGWDRI